MPKGKRWKPTESERQRLIAARREIPATLRELDARLATAWEADRDYAEAIKEAETGDPTRLINRLYAKLPLTADDCDALARYRVRFQKQPRRGRVSDSERQKAIAAEREEIARLTDRDYDPLAFDIERRKKQSRRGPPGEAAMRNAVHVAEQLLKEYPEERFPGWSRNEIIEYVAKEVMERWTGSAIGSAESRDGRKPLWERMNRPKGHRSKGHRRTPP